MKKIILLFCVLLVLAGCSSSDSIDLKGSLDKVMSEIDLSFYADSLNDPSGDKLVMNTLILEEFKFSEKYYNQLRKLYDSFVPKVTEVGENGEYIKLIAKVDSVWLADTFAVAEKLNKELNLPETLLEKIKKTRGLDGMQSYETDDLIVSWSYSSSDGLFVFYEKKK